MREDLIERLQLKRDVWRGTEFGDDICELLDEAADTLEALRAEVERLTFEMERLQQQYDERTACMIVHRGSALACSDAVRAAYSEEHERAERLAEALRDAADDLERGIDARIVVAQARAELRDQEEGNGQ